MLPSPEVDGFVGDSRLQFLSSGPFEAISSFRQPPFNS